MSKVKMSEIKSEKVKEIFRRTLSMRTTKFLSTLKLSNDDLIEILDLSENIEKHNERRFFYQVLIRSQEGPFSRYVFNQYKIKLFDIDALLHLLENTPDLNDSEKMSIIPYLLLASPNWTTEYFLRNGQSNNFGIDPFAAPFSAKIADDLMYYVFNKNYRRPKEYYNFFEKLLNTLTLEQLEKFYGTNIEKKDKKIIMEIFNKMEKLSPDLLRISYEHAGTLFKESLAKHPNCPEDLKQEQYELTGNEIFLPTDVKDIFIF